MWFAFGQQHAAVWTSVTLTHKKGEEERPRQTQTMAAMSFVSCVAGKDCTTDSAGSKVTGSVAGHSSSLVMRRLCGADGDGAAKSLLLPGASPEQRAEVDAWLDFSSSFSAEHLASLNKHLSGRSFLAGGAFSLADVAVYFACAPAMAAAAPGGKLLDLSRWFNQVQHRVRSMAPSFQAFPTTVSLDIFSPVAVPLPAKRPAPTASDTSQPVDTGSSARAAPTAGGGGGVAEEKAASSVPTEGAGGKRDQKKKTAAGPAGGGASGAGEEKAARADIPADGAGGKKDEKKKKIAAGAAAAAPDEAKKSAEPPPAGDEGDPSKLDVRVGVIVKAWEHPDSEKLFCEEIDLGEETTRMIASGLRAFYTLEEMQGRRVIVLANLKPRSIGGFKSNGMVLCASSADHSVVKIIEPPPGAAVGARVTVSGTEGDPATPAQMQKKKILEKCVPKLKTDGEGLPGYDGVGVFAVDGEPCVATIPGAYVS